ncbi:MAG: gliding motility protein GldN [Bacteroidales bacterium]|jgi:gliding motility associated protien GldN|nr:gliding motility protein GldN [Bacteroidales bacterium]
MKKTVFLIVFCVIFSFVFSQANDTQTLTPLTVPWEIIEVEEYPGVVPYPVVRQNDVMWSLTVWREIDLREKRNHGLYFPTEPQGIYRSLGQVILDAIDMDNPDNTDALAIYSDEYCTKKYERAEIGNVLKNTKKLMQFDPDTGEPIGEIDVPDPLTVSQIMSYRLKEVWFFDKNRGELSVRILEIEPFFEYEKDIGVNSGDDDDVIDNKGRRRLGYIKYDELRPYLAKQLYYLPHNSALQVTFDDVLTWKRYFASYIIAEGNYFNNREIQDYITNPRDQRLRSEEILNQIRTFESELWEY